MYSFGIIVNIIIIITSRTRDHNHKIEKNLFREHSNYCQHSMLLIIISGHTVHMHEVKCVSEPFFPHHVSANY